MVQERGTRSSRAAKIRKGVRDRKGKMLVTKKKIPRKVAAPLKGAVAGAALGRVGKRVGKKRVVRQARGRRRAPMD